MISRLLAIFTVVCASIYLGLWLQHDPGYVFISTYHWTIESTLWVAITAMMICAILAYGLLRGLAYCLAIPKHLRQWRTTKRLIKAQKRTKKGFIAFNEGRWGNAKTHLIAAATDSNLPLINYLTAAQAAEALGDHTLRDQCLYQAQTSNPEAIVAIELVQAQFQLDNQQWEQAHATLQHLQNIAPNHPYILKLLMRLYQAQCHWEELMTILPKIKASKLLPQQDLNQLKQQTYQHVLRHMITTSQPSDVKKWMQALPKDLKHDLLIAYDYSHYLIAQHDDKQAEAIIRGALQQHMDEKLISLYSQLPPDEVRLSFIESLLESYPDSASLYFCLGQLYAAQKLWGPAKNYFEKSIECKATSDAYCALGQLLEGLGDKRAACEAYRQGFDCNT